MSVVLNEAAELVHRQVGGARHHVHRCATGGPLRAEDSQVEDGEVLLVILHGKCFHLSPLCKGNISSQLPLPASASAWLDVQSTDAALATYVDKVKPGGAPPPIPIEVYSLAFRLRQGDDAGADHQSGRTGDALGVPSAVGNNKIAAPKKPVAAGRPSRSAAEIAAAAASMLTNDFSADDDFDNGASMEESGGGMCGFSEAELVLLMENGTRPWDDDAGDVLQRLKDRERQMRKSRMRGGGASVAGDANSQSQRRVAPGVLV